MIYVLTYFITISVTLSMKKLDERFFDDLVLMSGLRKTHQVNLTGLEPNWTELGASAVTRLEYSQLAQRSPDTPSVP